ncbi:MAG: universal stress protein [Blastocatellia bacterium]|nr:universal stress protein [Blastocatellia bacterium]
MAVLIATDGSPCSDLVIEKVAMRLWPIDSEFRIISVLEHSALGSISVGEYSLKLSEMWEEVRASTKLIAEAAADTLSSKGLKASYVICEGIAAEQIINEAKEWGADLIMLGTHGRKGLTKFLLGSVAQKVAIHAPCSVEIVRKVQTPTK